MDILKAELFRIERHMLREFGFIAQARATSQRTTCSRA